MPLPLWSAVPFVLLLLAIALLEVLAPGWWSRLGNKSLVTTALAVPAAIHMLTVPHGPEALTHSVTEYVAFIRILPWILRPSGRGGNGMSCGAGQE